MGFNRYHYYPNCKGQQKAFLALHFAIPERCI